MSTTEQMINAEMDQREQMSLRHAYLRFFERWAPDEDKAEFDADLMMLVHQIHREAAKPYQSMMTTALTLTANLGPIVFDPKGAK